MFSVAHPTQRWSQALRASNLLSLSVPREYGGRGAGWDEVLQTVRDLSERDGTLARLFAVHHLQLASVLLLGSREQSERLLPRSVECEWLWGEAVNHQERRLLAREHRRGGFLLQGGRHDCFGAEAVDWLLLSAWHAPSDGLLIAALPTDRDGLDRFEPNGGSLLRCHEVRLHPEDILQPPGLPWTPRAQLRGSLAALLQANLALGLAMRVCDGLPARTMVGGLRRIVGLGLRLSEQATVSLESALLAGNSLSFTRGAALATLVAETAVVAQQAVELGLRQEGVRARLLAGAT
ncbi:acyl-CoA dehydrogenase family protein [Pseudomonas sp. ZM23]|uniref:Acyl-CoA dehydrogenase family protein n=1 Tax=Pseudomonas triclosanedens TaxID=2961893 RepID=A0ABY6ZVV3_9PSED|nr:acyl-CoA dehydrogenase family protein [Pseudomonas triclosanedens]MCP8465346.1 acyl-CoA dehydrogenase family protein [Pseudomonas triclosanedens]MCP8470714.1 acyl-CoA dehydrogenase family protein [Pseudomonas triclosanedens]MCP8476645.1 acyl-CoA dehydrogenase family protein [Pseudomonas triclosanedens]WAI48901.1 acyl-CoA dehydrogenase family protein [Pseudomonas triclosanedens]